MDKMNNGTTVLVDEAYIRESDDVAAGQDRGGVRADHAHVPGFVEDRTI